MMETSHVLVGYSDANWGGNIDTRRSTTGYCFTMNGGCISNIQDQGGDRITHINVLKTLVKS